MSNTRHTFIHFDYGRYYVKDEDSFQWKSRGVEFHSFVIKKDMVDVTYSDLVDKVCRKLMVDPSTTKLKFNYYARVAGNKKPSYIRDGDDLYAYLGDLDNVQLRGVLNIEGIEEKSSKQSCQPLPRDDRGSGVGIEGFTSDGGDNDGIIGLNNEFESSVQLQLLEDVGHDDENRHCEDLLLLDNAELTRDVEADEVVEWEDGIDIVLGQEFESKREVQDLVEIVGHRNCFETVILKLDLIRYVLKCRDDGYKWGLRVAKVKNSYCFSVRTYNKMHTCSRVDTSTRRNKRRGTPRLVASILNEDYPGQFNTPAPKSLIGMVQGRFGVKVSYSTALRGKKQAAYELRASPEESYAYLPSYLYMLEKMNPGTVTRVEVDEEHKFKYLFFALGASIEGFRAMRKVIIVDGTFLKTAYGGVLIVATAQDPNHHHFPLAFGVVDGEKDASWAWLLNMLKTVIPDYSNIVFVSNRNASIIKSIHEVYPKSQHGYCIFHLSQNVKSHVHGVKKEIVAQKFRECAQIYTECEFKNLYGAFKKRYPTAGEYLDRSVVETKWARCYFPGQKYNIDTTNCVESINGTFREARKYALLPMINALVGKVAEWFNKHRKCSGEGPMTQMLVPYVENELHGRCAVAKLLRVQELNNFFLEYNVIGRDGKNYLVDLTSKTCTCRHFDIDRYPCVHAIAAAMSNMKKEIPLYQLCCKYYLMEQWVLAYCKTIFPVPHNSEWSVPEEIRGMIVLPPDYIKKRGRIQETRFPSVGEHGRRRSKRRSRGFYGWF